MSWLGTREDSVMERNVNDSRAEFNDSWRDTFRNVVLLT